MKTDILDLTKRNFLWMGAAALASLKLINFWDTGRAEAAARAESDFERVQKKIQKAQDYQECHRIWSIHSWTDAAGLNRKQIMETFAIDQPDVAFIQGNAMWVGYETIRLAYCDWDEASAQDKVRKLRETHPEVPFDWRYNYLGWQKAHCNASPLIYIAGDRKTAKAAYDSPGYGMWERFYIDYIMEKGFWKIWHMNILMVMSTQDGKSWASGRGMFGGAPPGAATGDDVAKAAASGASAGGQGGAPGSQGGSTSGQTAAPAMGSYGQGEKPGDDAYGLLPARTKNEARSDTYQPDNLSGPKTPLHPRLPVPYNTFSETHSYGPDMVESWARLDAKAKASKK